MTSYYGPSVLTEFAENGEEKPTPIEIRRYLRAFNSIGIFKKLNALIIGKPQDEKYYKEYLKVIKEEARRDDLPIMYI